MLTPEQQAEFAAEQPHVFIPGKGGWGRMGATHVNLAAANRDLLLGALQAAWTVRVEKNRGASAKKGRPSAKVTQRKK